MATATISAISEGQKREISELARACENQFLKYTNPDLPVSEPRARAELQQQRFYVWASYLGVFASPNASLDKRLEYSDDIQDLVVQLLSLMRRNLDFVILNEFEELPRKDAYLLVEGQPPARKPKLEGTISEALDAVEAAIDRLNKLGATIRKYSTSSLESRVQAWTEKHGEENYTALAKLIVQFKYRTAPSSLQKQLAISMSARRQRLRYISRHQTKLAAWEELKAKNEPLDKQDMKKPFPSALLERIDESSPENALTSSPARKRMAFRPTHNHPFIEMSAPSDTKASSFKLSQSVVARLKSGGGASVVSSSKNSTTFIAEDLENYPEAPKKRPGKLDPTCTYCCQPLQDSELKVAKWQRHVNKDIQPFVCISEKCSQPPQYFDDFEIWAKHMRDLHSTKWPQLVHKPVIWRCDVHEEEIFAEEESFEEHLNSHHSDYSPAERKAISWSSKITRRRRLNTYPLCGYDVSSSCHNMPSTRTQNKVSPKATNVEDPEHLNSLAKHIAGHLRLLAFNSSNNLVGSLDDVSQGSLRTLTLKTGKGSKTHPPSGNKDLSQISLNFTDDTATLHTNLETTTNVFDSDWTSADRLELEGRIAELEELPPEDFLHWADVKAILKEKMEPDILAELEQEQERQEASPDLILQHLYERHQLNTQFREELQAHRLGLLTLYPPTGSGIVPRLDIILVHGIDGDPVDTWKADDGTIWPVDLLPQRLPEVRVMSYGYRGIYNDTTSIATIYDHSLDLLNVLDDERKTTYEEERPIIFVGHSLGGIVIKQALLAASEYSVSTSHSDFRSRARRIFQSTYGVIFFSTPHNGINAEEWERFVKLVIENSKPDELRGVQIPNKVVKTIESSSDDLVQISQKFRSLEKIACVSFWEEFKTPKLGAQLVTKGSATMGLENEEIRMLPKHHFEICRFRKEDESFKQVLQAIKNIQERSPKAQETFRILGQVLKSLQVDDLRANPLAFKHTKNTCDWIAERKECKDWQDTSPSKGKLWIVGELGCGKTYLARHIANKEIQLGHIVAQCFLDEISENERTCKTILLVLLHEILGLCPHLINKFIVKVYYERRSKEDIWNLETLERLWPKVMLEAATIKPLTLIVDGLDRCGDDTKGFFECFTVCKGHVTKPGQLKLLVVSCNYPAYYSHSSTFRFIIYRITELDTREDIKATIRDCLEPTAQERGYEPELRELMYRKISEGANGMYLWARIMADEVKIATFSARQLEIELDSLPKGLIKLYDKILGRIGQHKKQKDFIRTTLFWTAFRHKELKAEEFRVGMAMSALTAEYGIMCIDEDTIQRFLPVGSILAMVAYFCGNLIECSGNKVNLVHESLKRFLTTPTEEIRQIYPEVQHHEDYFFHEADSHKLICDFCVAYLLQSSFEDSGMPFDPRPPGPLEWENKVCSRIEKHKFVVYAALNWVAHAKLSGEKFSVIDNWDPSRRMLLDLQNQQAICWTEVWWYCEKRKPKLQEYPNGDLRLEDICGVEAGPVNSSIFQDGGNSQLPTSRRTTPSSSQRDIRRLGALPHRTNFVSPVSTATNYAEPASPEVFGHEGSASTSTSSPQAQVNEVNTTRENQTVLQKMRQFLGL